MSSAIESVQFGLLSLNTIATRLFYSEHKYFLPAERGLRTQLSLMSRVLDESTRLDREIGS